MNAGGCVRVGDGAARDTDGRVETGEDDPPPEVAYCLTEKASAVCVARRFGAAGLVRLHPRISSAGASSKHMSFRRFRISATAPPAEADSICRRRYASIVCRRMGRCNRGDDVPRPEDLRTIRRPGERDHRKKKAGGISAGHGYPSEQGN